MLLQEREFPVIAPYKITEGFSRIIDLDALRNQLSDLCGENVFQHRENILIAVTEQGSENTAFPHQHTHIALVNIHME